MLLEAVVAIGTLAAAAWWYREPFGGAYIILSLLVFSLTFPGRAPRATSAAAIARDVLAGWMLIVGLLVHARLGNAHPRFLRRARAAGLGRVHARGRCSSRTSLLPVILPRLLAAEGMQRVAVIVGAGDLGRKLAGASAPSPSSACASPASSTTAAPERRGGDGRRERILGHLAQLADYVKTHRVDLIYIALPMASQPRILRLLDELRDTTASIYFVPDIFVFDLIQARVDTIGGMPVVAVCETPFYGVNGLIKRVERHRARHAHPARSSRRCMLAIALGGEADLARTGALPAAPLRRWTARRSGLQVPLDDASPRTAHVVSRRRATTPRVTPFGAFLRTHLARRAAAVHQRAAGPHERRRARARTPSRTTRCTASSSRAT